MSQVKIISGSEAIVQYVTPNFTDALQTIDYFTNIVSDARKELNSFSSIKDKTKFITDMHIYPYERNPLLRIAVSCITVAHCNQVDTLLITLDDKVVKQLDMTDFIFELDVSPETVIRLLHGMAVKYSNESRKTNTTESIFVPSTNLRS